MVTADGALEPVPDEPEESPEEEELLLESPDDVLLLESSDEDDDEEPESPVLELELLDDDRAPEDDVTAAVAWDVVAVAPIAPSYAIAPKARANVASAAATTRLRRRAIRAARARTRSWASSFGEAECSVMVDDRRRALRERPGRNLGAC